MTSTQFEDTRGVIRSCISKKDRPMINRKRAKRQADGQQKKDKKTDRWSTEKDKQWSTKHYTENQRSGNMFRISDY